MDTKTLTMLDAIRHLLIGAAAYKEATKNLPKKILFTQFSPERADAEKAFRLCQEYAYSLILDLAADVDDVEGEDITPLISKVEAEDLWKETFSQYQSLGQAAGLF